MTDSTVRESVARYLTRGLRPIPMFGTYPDGSCHCGGTECNAGKHAKDDAEPWKDGARHTPEDFGEQDNVAIALGPWRPGEWLVCLDFDGPDRPEVFFPDLPETLEQTSPRGHHLFFTVEEFAPLGNWVDALATKHRTGSAVDVRYARGKVNVAPSKTAFGAYEWTLWRAPARLPGWVIDELLDSRRGRGLPVARIWERKGKQP